MKIKLSKGRAFAIIDSEDAPKVLEHTWSLDSKGYASKNRNGTTIYMHRFILGLTDPNIHVDHINRNQIDNRKSNLRLSDHALNAQNSGPRRGKKFKGVFWDKSKGKWMASIMYRRKVYFLGRYETPEEAAKAYDNKAKELCENPYLNF